MSYIVANPFIYSSIQSGHVPVIGYHNLFETGTVTATDEATGFDKEFAYDDLPYRWWKGDSGAGTYYLTVDAGSATSADYYGIYAHNLNVAGGTVTPQMSSDNTTWNDVESGYAPSTTAPFLVSFGSYSRRYWRLKIVTTTSAPRIGVVKLGVRLEPERGLFAGTQPPNFAPIYESLIVNSENGVRLGQSKRLTNAKVNIDFKFCTTSWIANKWVPFLRHLEGRGFFYAWSSNNRPTEVSYCWLDGKISNPAYVNHEHIDVSIPVRAAIL